jgi:hypothetical protein
MDHGNMEIIGNINNKRRKMLQRKKDMAKAYKKGPAVSMKMKGTDIQAIHNKIESMLEDADHDIKGCWDDVDITF